MVRQRLESAGPADNDSAALTKVTAIGTSRQGSSPVNFAGGEKKLDAVRKPSFPPRRV
jgi:hypothetical protein